MVGECRSDAECQRVSWYDIRFREGDGPITFEREIAGEERAKRFDQGGLTVEIHCVSVGTGLLPGDANRAAAFALRGDVRRLAPFECFLDLANAPG